MGKYSLIALDMDGTLLNSELKARVYAAPSLVL